MVNSYPNSYSINMQAVEATFNQIFPSRPAQITRMTTGVSTFVYRIASHNEIFYLRILPEEDASFAPEADVHTRLQHLQVKVPEVIYFEHFHEPLQRSIMVTTEIKGLPLSQSSFLNNEELHIILVEAGHDLAHINRMPVDGFGWIERDQPETEHLRAQWPTHHDFVNECWDADLVFLAKSILSASEITQLERARSRSTSWFDSEQGYLAHGDLDLTHIYQDNGNYTGIIDFGEIRGASPWYYLGYFRMNEERFFPEGFLTALLRGYRDIAPLPPTYEQSIRLATLLITVRTLADLRPRYV